MAELFEISALGYKLQVTLDQDAAMEARRIASSWLSTATGITTWPDPPPEDLRTWALELASLVYDNPSWLEMEQVGDHVSRWALARRSEILTEARAAYAGAAASGQPVGDFPTPDEYPDPAPGYYGSFPVSWRLTP